MSDTTEICNLALSHARQDATIVNLETDNNTAAIRLRRIYKPTLNRVIQLFPWSFSQTEISLAPLNKEAYNGFDFVYQIPSDVLEVQKVSIEGGLLKTLSVGSDNNLWKVFPSANGLTKEIHTKFETATALVNLTSKTDAILDPLFVNYFAYELARQLANIYKIDAKEKSLLLQELLLAKEEAMSSSAMQEDTEFDNYNYYVDARGGFSENVDFSIYL